MSASSGCSPCTTLDTCDCCTPQFPGGYKAWNVATTYLYSESDCFPCNVCCQPFQYEPVYAGAVAAFAGAPPWDAISFDMNCLANTGSNASDIWSCNVAVSDCGGLFNGCQVPPGASNIGIGCASLYSIQRHGNGICDFDATQVLAYGPSLEFCIEFNVDGTTVYESFGPLASGETVAILPPAGNVVSVIAVTSGRCSNPP